MRKMFSVLFDPRESGPSPEWNSPILDQEVQHPENLDLSHALQGETGNRIANVFKKAFLPKEYLQTEKEINEKYEKYREDSVRNTQMALLDLKTSLKNQEAETRFV